LLDAATVDKQPAFAVSGPHPTTERQIIKSGKRRSWTTADVQTLKTLARKKTTAGKIAKKLKRTEGATRQKAFSLGVSLDARV
jgi:hypothetical protein